MPSLTVGLLTLSLLARPATQKILFFSHETFRLFTSFTGEI
jgi:hypothetical protein